MRTCKEHSNVVTRAVGVAEDLAVELTYHPAIPGDLYLLCTDGLTRQVAHARITELLGGMQSLRERCATLLAASEAAGGRDNTTVLLLRLRS